MTQSVVYGGATGGLFSLLQSAGATMVLPPVGAILAGAATIGAGIAVIRNESATTGKLLSDSIARGHHPGDHNDDDNDDGGPPPYDQTIPQEYLLTPYAIQAIVKLWCITVYNPPGIGAAGWLARVHKHCDQYEVPLKQRALCAMHHMRADCQEAAHAAGCYDMMWNQFTKWLLLYDGEVSEISTVLTFMLTRSIDLNRTSANSNRFPSSYRKWFTDLRTAGRTAELLVKKSKL